MTKKEIYSKVFEILANKRNSAILIAESNKEVALKDKTFALLCSEERLLNMQIGKAKFEKTNIEQFEKDLKDVLQKKQARLSELGFEVDDLMPKFTCKKCDDTGIYKNEMCSCANQLASDILMQSCGINLDDIPNLKNYDYKFFDDKTEKEFAKKCAEKFDEYVQNFEILKKKNIVMIGASGTGKTYLSKSLAKSLIAKNKTTFFVSAFDLNNMFLDEHLSKNDDMNNLRDLTNLDCLIIDDLGTEPMRKNVTKEYLLLLLNERLAKNKATIITTNLSQEQIMDKYEERIFSRMLDKRHTLVLMFNGKNVRLKK